MKTISKDFTCEIVADITAQEAEEMISRIKDWWVKDMEGNTKQLNDEFTVHFGTTWKLFKITERVPGKKIVWTVLDCHLPWNTDIKEWKGSVIIWDILKDKNGTIIRFNQPGLAAMDCGSQCMNSWTGYIKQSLYKFITEGKGSPNKF